MGVAGDSPDIKVANVEEADGRSLDGFAPADGDGVLISKAGRTAERPESVSRLRRLSSERISEACW
jgi:hypothetical protein